MESVDLRTSSYSFVGCMGLAMRVLFNATACCVVVAERVDCHSFHIQTKSRHDERGVASCSSSRSTM